MKLYRIIVLHGAPKDSHTSTETYLVAPDEEAVFAFVDNLRFQAWSDSEAEIWDEESDKDIPMKEWVMKKKGDLEDEDGWSDAYYGVTKMGWAEVEGATEQDIERLLALKIAVSLEQEAA
jgi:hypothetical protein